MVELPSAWLNRLKAAPSVWVALSGGVDSMTLLHWASQLGLANLKAVHINHNIQADADAWASFCVAEAAKMGITCVVHSVLLGDQDSLETMARDARYEVFEQLLASDDVLLQGHHANDQAETLLFRMLRSSTWRSLRGIPAERPLGKGIIYRPWLNVPRSKIERYAADNQIDYVSDPSNLDDTIDRNYLRHKILRPLIHRWPHVIERFAALSVNAQAQFEAQNQLASFWLQHQEQNDRFGPWLDLNSLEKLAVATRQVVVGEWLQAKGVTPTSSLQPIYEEPYRLMSTNWKLTLGDHEIYVDQHRLRLQSPKLELAVKSKVWLEGIELEQLANVSVERFHPQGRDRSQRLKKLLQEWQVPARYRPYVPVLEHNGVVLLIDHHWAFGEKHPQHNAEINWPAV